MDDDAPFEFPGVTEEDIRWATQILGIPAQAFHGNDGNDPRQEVLKCKESIDVAACPGSGKTTLLVAKLAILASKWQHRTRGICVLSHTNEARRQIESKLGNTGAGRRLLAYPHFVGTIHGFVNEFLALPWLRSRGYPVTTIDSDICERRRWNKLPKGTQTYLEKNGAGASNICIVDCDFHLAKKNGSFPCGKGTDTYSKVQEGCRAVALEGYHCYDDMFIWAQELMDELPMVSDVIRDRFPVLFIDEAQDNSEAQSAILCRIFPAGQSPVVRQRFGDDNQAIFGFVGEKGAKTDPFPDPNVTKELPNSHRFGPSIAQLAAPLGVTPHEPVLTGQGPGIPLSSGQDAKHTVFLFNDNDQCRVMKAYTELLLRTFTKEELAKRDAFWAVGLVHKDRGDDHWPRHVGHYCPAYDPELSKSEPRPQTFTQYALAGIAKSRDNGEAHFAVEKIAEGVLCLAETAGATRIRSAQRYKHRHILELLEDCGTIRERYVDLIEELALEGRGFTPETWDSQWKDVVWSIAAHIAGEQSRKTEVEDFLSWGDYEGSPVTSACEHKGHGNLCCYPCSAAPQVRINIGSIHSVKGQNHLATLVLETYWQDKNGRHNIELLLPWLLQDNTGGQGVKAQQLSRLKTHYVAMTRPTHLLCLAMKRSAFGDGNGGLDSESLAKLKQQGWNVKCV